MTAENIKFSFIIPVFNSEKTIHSCLEAIFLQKCTGTFEVILVDDLSKDQTLKIASSFNCKVVVLTMNQGPGYARNEGAKVAQGEFLVFVDSDCFLEPDWLMEAEKLIKEKGFESIRGITVKATNKGVIGKLRFFESNLFVPGKEVELDAVSTDNYLISMKLFKDIKGFPSIYYQEDMLLGFRIMQTGKKTILSPKLKISQFYKDSCYGYLKQQLLWAYYGMYYRLEFSGITKMKHAYTSIHIIWNLFFTFTALVSLIFLIYSPRLIIGFLFSGFLLLFLNKRLFLNFYRENGNLFKLFKVFFVFMAGNFVRLSGVAGALMARMYKWITTLG